MVSYDCYIMYFMRLYGKYMICLCICEYNFCDVGYVRYIFGSPFFMTSMYVVCMLVPSCNCFINKIYSCSNRTNLNTSLDSDSVSSL